MSIGIRLHDASGNTLCQRAQNAKAQGFSCVHLALSKAVSPSLMEPAAATFGLSAHVKEELGGLRIAVLGCYLNLAHPDEKEYKKTLQKYVAQLKLASYLGAGVVGTETGNPNAEYRYDAARSHTEDALKLFIDRLFPVVEAAEKFGQVIAIEPVYTHIVCNGLRARRVLDTISSPNLQIIFDPVNLPHPDNVDNRDKVIDEAIDCVGQEVAVIHVKDYIREGNYLRSMAAGTGEMNYDKVFRFAAECKPHIDMTLEDTTPENAEAARRFVASGMGYSE